MTISTPSPPKTSGQIPNYSTPESVSEACDISSITVNHMNILGREALRADWLVNPLIQSGILDSLYSGAKVAPVVLGIAVPTKRDLSKGIKKTMIIRGNPNTLAEPPLDGEYFNPHYTIKREVNRQFNEMSKRCKPLLYPGYAFWGNGFNAALLDSRLSDQSNTAERLEGVSDIMESLGFTATFVGTEQVDKPGREPELAPSAALPSAIRIALAPLPNMKVPPINPASFASAAKETRALEDQIE